MSIELMKSVINECEGYFDLSKEAYERYLELNPSFDSYNLDAESIKRTDKSLIKVVEELGSAANTNHSKLKIYSIPCGSLYSRVDNCKGMEDLDVYILDNWCIATKDGEVELKDIIK